MSDPSHPDTIRQTRMESGPPEDEPATLSLRSIPAPEALPSRPARLARSDDDTQPFRPSLRPPTALLHVLDDNQQSAEVVRLRTASFIIGRTEGDLLLPHDRLISSRHAQLVREHDNENCTWTLRDLQSSNGTFVRVRRATLKSGRVFLVGGTRLRFELPSAVPNPPDAERETLDLASLAAQGKCLAFLVELVPGGDGRRFAVNCPVVRLGRDPQQADIVLDDSAQSPCHALLAMQPGGTWTIEDLDSFNGLWVRTSSVRLVHGASFLLGEQVFVFTLP